MTSHGILNPRAGAAHFTLERFAPSPELAGFVERYWIVRWRLDAPFQQETLPHPAVNVVAGTHRTGVHGVPTRRFVADLDGAGFVVGAKFRPGGFSPFLRDDAVTLTGRARSLVEAFGEPARALDPAAIADLDDRALVAAMERFLVEREPVRDAGAELATRIVETVHGDPRIARTAELAARFDLSPRTLERLFRRHVGVSPKWVIRRYRVHEACERAKTGTVPDWAALAAELGYFDQSHFIRDFKAQVGRTPAEYAALCACA
jgi:AraC-like DNA-binding protein